MHAPYTNHRVRLAEAIVRDLLCPAHKPQTSPTCFTCSRSFSNGDGRFCSHRCRQAFDAGFPPYEPFDRDEFYSLPKGQTGFWIECACCRKPFDSRGLRCCSAECERELRRKQELDAELENDPFRAVKRKCNECGGDIPNWRKGRRVSKAAKFCSPRCKAQYGKSARMALNSPNPVLERETAKKPHQNGPRQRGCARPSLSAEAAE